MHTIIKLQAEFLDVLSRRLNDRVPYYLRDAAGLTCINAPFASPLLGCGYVIVANTHSRRSYD
jgi:hypothetical protein